MSGLFFYANPLTSINEQEGEANNFFAGCYQFYAYSRFHDNDAIRELPNATFSNITKEIQYSSGILSYQFIYFWHPYGIICG